MKQMDVNEDQLARLAAEAWKSREHAYVIGNTKVGASALSSDGNIFAGCNVEHRFRAHDVHAEVSAITSMVAAGKTELRAIVIAAKRRMFTPCGGCLDWIFQFGGPSCIVACQSAPHGKIQVFRAHELMPYYPE